MHLMCIAFCFLPTTALEYFYSIFLGLFLFFQGLKTGMYYLRSKPAANAIQFTVDQRLVAKKKSQGKLDADKQEAILACSLQNPQACEMCSAWYTQLVPKSSYLLSQGWPTHTVLTCHHHPFFAFLELNYWYYIIYCVCKWGNPSKCTCLCLSYTLYMLLLLSMPHFMQIYLSILSLNPTVAIEIVLLLGRPKSWYDIMTC